MSASALSEPPVALLRYLDVVLVVVGAPIFLLIGVPAAGYGAGAGSWIVLRALGVGLDRYLAGAPDAARELTLRLAYLIGRLVALALTVILVRRGAGRDAGLTALVVIVLAFTIQLIVSIATRPSMGAGAR